MPAAEWRLKRFRGRWYAVRPGPSGTERRSLRTADRDTAARTFRDLTAALARPQTEATAATLYAAYLADKPNDRAEYAWKRLADHFGHLAPHHITRATCRLYSKAREAQGASTGTIYTELLYLRAALRRNDRASPAVIEMPARAPPRERHLDRSEYIRLRAAARATPHLYVFLVLALSTGARRDAVLGLKWAQIDWERQTVNLGKGSHNKRRGVKPLSARAMAVLRRAQRGATSEYVVEWAGDRVRSVRTAWASACAEAGLGPDVTPHVLRHTAGVWMAEDGVSMAEIAQVLGHTSTAITEQVYARFTPTHLRRATRALR